MQTKTQIRQLLESQDIKPKKSLGQHFLIDLNLMKKLLDAADIQKDDIVIEVGCGTGSLTEELAKKAKSVIAVEIDKNFADIANQKLICYPNIEVINADILKNKNTINLSIADKIKTARKKSKGRVLLVSNLPYNIASPLMLNLITGPTTVDAMYVTVQKEVAERMTAKPDNKNYGTLSILLSATGDVKKITTLKPAVFWPPPKVTSAMISYTRSSEKTNKIKSVELLVQLTGSFMQHRRKTLFGCTRFAKGQLKQINNWLSVFENCKINPQKRPEQIPPSQYVQTANYCFDLLK
jgi:16S rRNA (adenine1518-N6/adenine1519-N6)-dimethyltransferase